MKREENTTNNIRIQEIDALSRSVYHRQKSDKRIPMKLFFWKATIAILEIIKRTMDIVLSSIALVALSPIFFITTLSIMIEDGLPVIFKQKRIGKNGQIFTVYKFRSMVKNAEVIKQSLEKSNESKDGVIFKIKKDPRITHVGRIIRKLSIDELPQFFNVFRGDMSLVGPRPAIPSEVNEYSLAERKRLDVKPGITCIWQVSGRSEIPFHEQVRLDIRYIKSRSVLTDIKLLFKTIPAILFGKGAY